MIVYLLKVKIRLRIESGKSSETSQEAFSCNLNAVMKADCHYLNNALLMQRKLKWRPIPPSTRGPFGTAKLGTTLYLSYLCPMTFHTKSLEILDFSKKLPKTQMSTKGVPKWPIEKLTQDQNLNVISKKVLDNIL